MLFNQQVKGVKVLKARRKGTEEGPRAVEV
jgi:hypothetical protein